MICNTFNLCRNLNFCPFRGQQFAQQMQQQNPELIEQLRSQIRSRPPSASNEEQPWYLQVWMLVIKESIHELCLIIIHVFTYL